PQEAAGLQHGHPCPGRRDRTRHPDPVQGLGLLFCATPPPCTESHGGWFCCTALLSPRHVHATCQQSRTVLSDQLLVQVLHARALAYGLGKAAYPCPGQPAQRSGTIPRGRTPKERLPRRTRTARPCALQRQGKAADPERGTAGYGADDDRSPVQPYAE